MTNSNLTTNWRIDVRNPTIAPGQLHGALDARRAGAAHVVRCGDMYRLVYWGTGRDGGNRILSAQAPVDAPNRWEPLGELLGPQPETAHNSVGPSFPFLLPVTETRWHLYFCGWGRAPDRRLPNTTGVAISDDGGSSWHYQAANPILALDRPYDQQATGSIWVLYQAGKFRMYYTAIGRYFNKPANVESGHGDVIPEIGIGYAESGNGIDWHKPFDNLIVRPRHFGVEPYEYICSKPCVIVGVDGTYTMWVNTFGTAYRVHRLTSRDGFDWEWAPRCSPEGELGVGAPGEFDDQQRCYPTVVEHEGEYRCWFTGNGFGATGLGFATAPLNIE